MNSDFWRRPAVWGPMVLFWGLALALWLGGWNQPLFLALNGGQSEWLWSALTILGDTAVALVLLLPLCGREPRLISALFIALVIGTVFIHGAKAFFDELRPAAVLAAQQIQVIGPELKRHSFPSGHTATALIAAGLVLLHFRASPWLWWVLPLALLAGLSRVMVGAHWPLDVLVGAGLGWLTAALSIYLAQFWSAGTRPLAQRIMAGLLLLTAFYLLLAHDTQYPQALWLQYIIGVAAILLALPGLRRLFGRA